MKKCKLTRLNILIAIASFLFVLEFPLLLNIYLNLSLDVVGQYGDFFGSINAIVSALAFAGLIYTIILQRNDLTLQRAELQLTRRELHRTAKAQEESVKEQERQAQLLEEQINKDIRPYINAFLNHGYLVIKNVGKTACTNFKMEICNIKDFEEIDLPLKEFIENTTLSVFPAGIQYKLYLGVNRFDDEIFERMKQNKKHLIIRYSFWYREKMETFMIDYDLNEIEGVLISADPLESISSQLAQIHRSMSNSRF